MTSYVSMPVYMTDDLSRLLIILEIIKSRRNKLAGIFVKLSFMLNNN